MFQLRPIAMSDAAAVAALIRAAFTGIDPPLDPPPSALGETADSVARHIESHGGHVAEIGRVVGSVLWQERDNGLYVGRLSVAQEARGQGIARALIEAAIAQAHADGLPRVHLGTRLALTGNRRLFASLGFIEIALHSHAGYSQPTWVEMERQTC